MEAIKLIIQGRVQGVYFRKFVETEALKLNLKGYVKNNPNGDVIVVAQGEKNKLYELKIKCFKGPTSAKVEGVLEIDIKPSKEFKTFSISY